MKTIIQGLWAGTLCLGIGILTGCAQLPSGTSGLADTVTSATSPDNLLDQSVNSAKKGDMKAATGYLSSWYALQNDKTVAIHQLEDLAFRHASDAAGKMITNTLSQLTH